MNMDDLYYFQQVLNLGGLPSPIGRCDKVHAPSPPGSENLEKWNDMKKKLHWSYIYINKIINIKVSYDVYVINPYYINILCLYINIMHTSILFL